MQDTQIRNSVAELAEADGAARLLGEEALASLDIVAGVLGQGEALASARAAAESAARLSCIGQEAARRVGLGHAGTPVFRLWSVPGSGWVAFARFTPAGVSAAFGCRPDGQEPLLPEEVRLRLSAVRANPSLAPVLTRSAADHMAAHVMESVKRMPGSAPDGDGVLWSAAGNDPGDLPVCLAWLSQDGLARYADSIDVLAGGESA